MVLLPFYLCECQDKNIILFYSVKTFNYTAANINPVQSIYVYRNFCYIYGIPIPSTVNSYRKFLNSSSVLLYTFGRAV